MPRDVQKIASMIIGQPTISAEDLGQLIEKDQVLSTKVLRLANAPFHGFSSPIAWVAQAAAVAHNVRPLMMLSPNTTAE